MRNAMGMECLGIIGCMHALRFYVQKTYYICIDAKTMKNPRTARAVKVSRSFQYYTLITPHEHVHTTHTPLSHLGSNPRISNDSHRCNSISCRYIYLYGYMFYFRIEVRLSSEMKISKTTEIFCIIVFIACSFSDVKLHH